MHKIHISTVGARTPLGITADTSMAAVRAGIGQISEHPFIVDQMGEPVMMAQDSQLSPWLTGPQRCIEMATTALLEICRKLKPVWHGNWSIPTFLCMAEERPGWTQAHMLAVRDGLISRPMPIVFHPIEIVALGHAAGLKALEIAYTRIQAEKYELSAIIGVDSYWEHETLVWLDQNRQLATSYHRGAFFPGEGAGAFIIASDAVLRRLGLDSMAVVRGIGTAKETNTIKTDAICLGEGLTECVRKAVMPLHLPDEAVEGIICDINGERYRSEEWGFALLRIPEAFVDPSAYDVPASCWGDVGAASGPLFVTMAVTAAQRGWAKGMHYLIWTSSEGGQRAAAALALQNSPQGGG